jgi:hypothetical protein
MVLKIGTVIEIGTSKGFVYAQYTHRHANYGYLIRVIQGLHESTPTDIDSLAKQPTNFVTFFPLAAAIKRKLFKVIGVRPVPEFAQNFPIFKTGHYDKEKGKITVWFLWDGTNNWRVDKLTEEEKDYPIRGIINDTLLIEYIETEWTPRRYTE